MATRKPVGRVIAAADRARGIRCDMPARGTDALEWCPDPALMCETVFHTGGVSFYHYCAKCWHVAAANGGPSAAKRTGVELPDVLDFERRWLAECRAHGETRRKLIAAGVELPDVLDFERRWLAECRAHGETRRKLIAAHHELGDHSDCRDCDRTDEDAEGYEQQGDCT